MLESLGQNFEANFMEEQKQVATTQDSVQTAVLEKEEASEAVAETPVKKEKGLEKRELGPIEYFENAKVTCSCGTTFTVGSTRPEIHVEVCSKCHPFFTGQAKFVDTEGRVEAFERRLTAKKDRKAKKPSETKAAERPKSLKEMLELIEAS